MTRAGGALALTVLSCSSHPGHLVDAPPDVVDAVDAGLTWDSVETLASDSQVVTERVTYHSGPLKIYARICRPADGAPHPLVIYNHGGWFGIDGDALAFTGKCQDTARAGYVWVGSSYRGEDGSEGSIELCLGEVDDVLRALEIARVQPYADSARVFMWGASHGGCITQRALESGADVKAAAELFGPTDHASLDRYWHTDPTTYASFIAELEGATGGTPDTVPAAYLARSPIAFIGDIPTSVPLFVAHGADDTLVPYAQSCNLASAPLGFEAYHLDGSAATTTAPAGCTDPAITWQTGARPTPAWPASRYLVIYDGLGHDDSTAAATTMLQDVTAFAEAHLRVTPRDARGVAEGTSPTSVRIRPDQVRTRGARKQKRQPTLPLRWWR